MIGFTKNVSQQTPRQTRPDADQEPRTGRITLTSILVMVAVLGMAIVNQYLAQQ